MLERKSPNNYGGGEGGDGMKETDLRLVQLLDTAAIFQEEEYAKNLVPDNINIIIGIYTKSDRQIGI